MERWIKFITVLCILGAFHLSLSKSVPVPGSEERGKPNPFRTKGETDSRLISEVALSCYR